MKRVFSILSFMKTSFTSVTCNIVWYIIHTEKEVYRRDGTRIS